jgi:uncharacterized protein (UPF0335 family)
MSESLQDSSQKQLKQFVDQIERLEDDKRGIADDIKDKYLEAESSGFDKKVLKKVIALRRKSKAELEAEASLLDVYLHALET